MKGYAMLKIGESGWIEKDRPACGPMDAICKPLAVAICTSDVHTRSFSDRFQTFQYLDLICSVFCTHPYPPKFLFKNQFSLRSPGTPCQSKNYSRSVHPGSAHDPAFLSSLRICP